MILFSSNCSQERKESEKASLLSCALTKLEAQNNLCIFLQNSSIYTSVTLGLGGKAIICICKRNKSATSVNQLSFASPPPKKKKVLYQIPWLGTHRVNNFMSQVKL